jgi:predicted unusual protein kinase regulating ubiquinone biosynthesis (AarF/ABC1/UbiB family)
MIGLYRAALNSGRTLSYLYDLRADFKELTAMTRDSEGFREKAEGFKRRSAERIQQLCQVNRGVYARMGQIISAMTDVLP